MKNFSFISSTFLCLAYWLWHRCFLWFHQSHRFPMLLHPLRHRGCLYDITGALFCSLGTCCGWFPVSPSSWVLFQSAFLHVFVTKWHFTNLVDPTIASLTPLLSWLKGAPPGINPSSRQQKNARTILSLAEFSGGRHISPPPFTGAVRRGTELRNLGPTGIWLSGGWDDEVCEGTSTEMVVANAGTSGGNLECFGYAWLGSDCL